MEVKATQKDVINILEDTLNSLRDTLDKKGKDYSGEEDTFKNFKISAMMLSLPVHTVILSRMGDKFSRLTTILNSGGNNVEDETVEDTINDLIGYAILLKTYITKKKEIEHESISDLVDPPDFIVMDDRPPLNPTGLVDYIVTDDDGEIN